MQRYLKIISKINKKLNGMTIYVSATHASYSTMHTYTRMYAGTEWRSIDCSK